MATFVLVHGSGGGGWIWKKVAPLLRGAGHEVYTPTLTGCGERVHLHRADVGLDTHILDIVGVLTFEDLSGVILVGHSYGGNVITGVADRVPERLAHLVYVDANVPHDGQALVDLMPPPAGDLYPGRSVERGEQWRKRGWLLRPETTDVLPAAEAPATEQEFADLLDRGVLTPADVQWMLRNAVPHPAKTYLDPVRWRDPAALALPRTFIHCTGKRGWDAFAPFAKRAKEQPGWRCRQIETEHDAEVYTPHELADLLLECVNDEGPPPVGADSH